MSQLGRRWWVLLLGGLYAVPLLRMGGWMVYCLGAWILLPEREGLCDCDHVPISFLILVMLGYLGLFLLPWSLIQSHLPSSRLRAGSRFAGIAGTGVLFGWMIASLILGAWQLLGNINDDRCLEIVPGVSAAASLAWTAWYLRQFWKNEAGYREARLEYVIGWAGLVNIGLMLLGYLLSNLWFWPPSRRFDAQGTIYPMLVGLYVALSPCVARMVQNAWVKTPSEPKP